MRKPERTTGRGRSWTFPVSAAEWWIAWANSNRTSGHAVQRWGGVDRQGTGRQLSSRHDWKLSERFEQGEIDVEPDDDKLAAQLGSIKWGIDSRGRIKIESKDEMGKQGLPSPDRGRCDGHNVRATANAAPMKVKRHAGESMPRVDGEGW